MLRTSIRFSSDFILLKYSSPSFGSSFIYFSLYFIIKLFKSPIMSFQGNSIIYQFLFNSKFHFLFFNFINKRDSLIRVSRRVNLLYPFQFLQNVFFHFIFHHSILYIPILIPKNEIKLKIIKTFLINIK